MKQTKRPDIPDIIKTMQDFYGFTRVTAVEPNSHTWGGRFVATLKADGAKYLLKEYPWFSRSEEHIALVLRVQDLVREKGLPVPDVVRAVNGSRTLAVAERRLFLMHHVGQACDPGSRSQKSAALRLLGRLHRVLTDFPLEAIENRPEDPLRAALDRMLAYFGNAQNSLLENAGSDKEREELNTVLGGIETRLREAAALVGATNELPVSILHGDFQLYNLRFEGERVAGIVDWDAVWFGPRLFELAGAIAIMYGKNWDNEYARDRVWRTPLPLDRRLLSESVALYEEDGPPLTAHERALLPQACALKTGVQLAGFYQQPYPSPVGVEQVSDAEGCRNLLEWFKHIW